MGWAGKTNGTLLTLAQVDFDVFLTVDRNLSFQQDVNKFSIAVVVLVAKSNKHSALQPLITEVLSVLPALAPGQVFGWVPNSRCSRRAADGLDSFA